MSMERKIGEVFEYQGVKIKTIKNPMGCDCRGCYFDCEGRSCLDDDAKTGHCSNTYRRDGICVIFKLLK